MCESLKLTAESSDAATIHVTISVDGFPVDTVGNKTAGEMWADGLLAMIYELQEERNRLIGADGE